MFWGRVYVCVRVRVRVYVCVCVHVWVVCVRLTLRCQRVAVSPDMYCGNSSILAC